MKTYAEAIADIVAIGIPVALVGVDEGDAYDYGAPMPSHFLHRAGKFAEYDEQMDAYNDKMADIGSHPERYTRRWARVDTDPEAVRECLKQKGDYYHLCGAIEAIGWINWDGGTYRMEVDPASCPGASTP